MSIHPSSLTRAICIDRPRLIGGQQGTQGMGDGEDSEEDKTYYKAICATCNQAVVSGVWCDGSRAGQGDPVIIVCAALC